MVSLFNVTYFVSWKVPGEQAVSTLMLIMMKLMRNNDDEDAHCDYEDENS